MRKFFCSKSNDRYETGDSELRAKSQNLSRQNHVQKESSLNWIGILFICCFLSCAEKEGGIDVNKQQSHIQINTNYDVN